MYNHFEDSDPFEKLIKAVEYILWSIIISRFGCIFGYCLKPLANFISTIPILGEELLKDFSGKDRLIWRRCIYFWGSRSFYEAIF